MNLRINNSYAFSMRLKIKEEKWFGADFFLSLFLAIIQALIYYYLFQVVFAGNKQIEPVTITEYYIIINLVAEIYYPAQFTAWRHMDDINTGRIINYLVKPYNYTYMRLAESSGLFGIRMMINLVIIFIASLILETPIPVQNYVLGAISMVIGFLILYTIQAIIGCMTVWFHEINKLRNVFMTLLMILGGRIIPSSLLFSGLKNIVYFTPIPYVYDIPVRIFQQQDGIQQILIQCAWLFLFWGIYQWLFNKFVAHGAEYGG